MNRVGYQARCAVVRHLNWQRLQYQSCPLSRAALLPYHCAHVRPDGQRCTQSPWPRCLWRATIQARAQRRKAQAYNQLKRQNSVHNRTVVPAEASGRERPLQTDRQTDRHTVLIGTRTHTHPGSIASRLRLCLSHVTTTYWDYIGSSRVWKCTTPHPLSPGYPSRRS